MMLVDIHAIKALLLRMAFKTAYARLSVLTIGAVVILSFSGSLLAHPDVPRLILIHRLIGIASGLLLANLLRKTWQTQRSRPLILVSTVAGFVLFLAQALLGAQLAAVGADYLGFLHRVTALAVWGALTVQVISVGLSANSQEEEYLAAVEFSNRNGMLQDVLQLTKPIVVTLLLVTTFAGMVIGAQAFPPLPITVWTLIGGFLAAGGSGAINQYIDRFDDSKMQCTQKRPIPSGRLTAGEGLAIGVAMIISSFYVMVIFVNLTAALLTLTGIIYYVCIDL